MSSNNFDVENIRLDFPILDKKVNGKKLIYFDNAATSQTPKQVIDVISDYYLNYNSNIHRGVHFLSQQATELYEGAREKLKNHFNAKLNSEIIFTSGTTHAINIVSSGYREILSEKDELIVSELEHHSNIVPWQILCEKTGSKLKVIPMNDLGELELDKFDELLNENTKLVFVNHVSNALGTINPISEIIRKAHKYGAKVLIDGAQASAHFKIDLQNLDVDYYVTSAHKLCGPTGVGMLYGKKELLEKLPPYQGGGEMIDQVTFEKTTYAGLPHKFEAGTPNIAGAVGIGASIDFINGLDRDLAHQHEMSLHDYALEKLEEIEGVRIIGNASNKSAIISFVIDGLHPHDIGTIINQKGIAVRTGHHCTMPLMDFYRVPGTVRASFSIYNNHSEVDKLIDAIKLAIKMLK